MTFDPNLALSALLDGTGVTPDDTEGKIEIVGEDPIMPSVHRLAAAGALAMMSGAVGAATIWKMRNGKSQDLRIDLREAVHGVNPHLGFGPTLNGYPYPRDADGPSPVPHTPQQLADGRWAVLTAHFQHSIYRWLELLGCAPRESAVIRALQSWNSAELEEAAADKKLAFSLCETPQSWLAREQGKLLAATPVVEVTKIAESEREPFAPGERPLSGVRVLQLTHAISGPTVARTLAEQGAEALHLPSPRQLELEHIYNDACVGTRSAFVDLKDADGLALARGLARGADVVVENFRGGAADRLGFGPDELAALRPGVIVVSARCYGYRGPWWNRGGHDLQGTAASGIMTSEGSVDEPRFPLTRMLNDYLTGYLGAAGATAALVRRAREGGSYHVSVSLTRNAMWCQSLGVFDKNEVQDIEWDGASPVPPSVVSATPLGRLHRLAPCVRFSDTPPYWSEPILVPRGSGEARWI